MGGEACPACSGNGMLYGHDPRENVECEHCDGSGEASATSPDLREGVARIIDPGAWWHGPIPNDFQQRRVDRALAKVDRILALAAEAKASALEAENERLRAELNGAVCGGRHMRVLICGGRNFTDYQLFARTLCAIRDEVGRFTEIVHGAAPGADWCAHLFANSAPDLIERAFPADWKTHGKAAGPKRNQQMLDEGKPELVVAFPGGRGTADMVRRAKKAGVPVIMALASCGEHPDGLRPEGAQGRSPADAVGREAAETPHLAPAPTEKKADG